MKNPTSHDPQRSKFEPSKEKPKPPRHEFFVDLEKNARPDWKKAPAELRKRYRGIFLILVSIPIIFVPALELWRRMEGKSTRKVQQGEVVEGKTVRKFDEAEKWQREKDSVLYKLFGRDFYLDGFTTRTMKPAENHQNNHTEKSNEN